MNEFGVCRCDNSNNKTRYISDELNITELVRCKNYLEAYRLYVDRALSKDGYAIDRDIWLVYIDDGYIVQFEQLTWSSKVRRRKITDELTNP